MEKSKVKLNICGTSYTITSDDTEEYIYSIGEEVDKKIRSTLEKNQKLSTLMAAELAALEYCDLLNKSSISIENLKKQLDDNLKELNDLKENLEIKNLELDDIKLKLKFCEDKLRSIEEKNDSNKEMHNKEILTESKSIDEIMDNDKEIFENFSNMKK